MPETIEEAAFGCQGDFISTCGAAGLAEQNHLDSSLLFAYDSIK